MGIEWSSATREKEPRTILEDMLAAAGTREERGRIYWAPREDQSPVLVSTIRLLRKEGGGWAYAETRSRLDLPVFLDVIGYQFLDEEGREIARIPSLTYERRAGEIKETPTLISEIRIRECF